MNNPENNPSTSGPLTYDNNEVPQQSKIEEKQVETKQKKLTNEDMRFNLYEGGLLVLVCSMAYIGTLLHVDKNLMIQSIAGVTGFMSHKIIHKNHKLSINEHSAVYPIETMKTIASNIIGKEVALPQNLQEKAIFKLGNLVSPFLFDAFLTELAKESNIGVIENLFDVAAGLIIGKIMCLHLNELQQLLPKKRREYKNSISE